MITHLAFIGNIFVVILVIAVVIIIGFLALIIKWYKKPIHGKALVRTGQGGTKVTFEKGFFVIPVLHRIEIMDITLKTITISREGGDGLICKDNVRADIKVAFFIRVNNTFADARNVALSIGCERASAKDTLETLFDAKFSEALKTVGKQFDFVDLYKDREEFKKEILSLIGRNLNGYLLDDCAIDYLEQTPLESMKESNILDSEGIKKIIQKTSAQQIEANLIENEKRKKITKQDVDAQETILQYERQLAEKVQTQKKEIANITDIQEAETIKVAQEQRLISEKSIIATEEEIEVARQNKDRQIIAATWNKERTDVVEQEKVEKDKMLQVTDREKIVALAQIEKDKEVEMEKANIQKIIRDRVMVQKDVVVEQEKIKDTEAFAGAQRSKTVAIVNAEKVAEEALVKQIKNSEANRTSAEIDGEAQKIAAEYDAKQKLIEAETSFAAAGKESEAIKTLAEAESAKESALGKAEAQVIEAKADAFLKDGESKAKVLEMQAIAEAKGIEAKAVAKSKEIDLVKGSEARAHLQTGDAEAKIIKQKGLSQAEVNEKLGFTEAKIIEHKLTAEAKGIESKAAAMKKLDGVGKEHEEFKLQLNKDKEVEIAQINIWKEIANAQAHVIAEAVKAANIDIVGGETMFFDKIIGSITRGRTIDTMFENSKVLSAVKEKFVPSKKELKEKENKKETKKEKKDENIAADAALKTAKSIQKKEKKTDIKKTSSKKTSNKKSTSKAKEIIKQAVTKNIEYKLDSIDEVEGKLKELFDKYKFILKGVSNMKVIDVLRALTDKIPDKKTKEFIIYLKEKVDEFGIGDILVRALEIK